MIFVAAICERSATLLQESGPWPEEALLLLPFAADCPEAIEAASLMDRRVFIVSGALPSAGSRSQHQVEFEQDFMIRFGTEPDMFARHGHDAALVIIEAMKVGARHGEEIRREILRIRHFEGATGSLEFDENGDNIDTSRFRVVEIEL